MKNGESAAEEANHQIVELKEQLAEMKIMEQELQDQVLKLSLEKNEAFQAIPVPVEMPVLDIEEEQEELDNDINGSNNNVDIEEDVTIDENDKKNKHDGQDEEEEEDDNNDDDDDGHDSGFEEESSKAIPLESNINDLHDAGGGASLDQLQQESAELLKGIDEAEMDEGNGNSSRGKFVSGFAKLKHDYDTHVRRLLAKLAAEQMARSNLEDEIDTMNQKQGSPGKGSWMRNMFGGNKTNSNRVTKQERALKETVFDLLFDYLC